MLGSPTSGVYTADPSIYHVYAEFYKSPRNFGELEIKTVEMEICKADRMIGNEAATGFCFVEN